MKIHLIISSVILGILSVFSPAIANDAPFVTLSEGQATCGEYIKEPHSGKAIVASWVLGYISGRNRESSSPEEKEIGSSYSKPETIYTWLDNYCHKHALDTLTKAADSLRQDFLEHERH